MPELHVLGHTILTKNHRFDNIMSLFRGTSRLIFKNLEFENTETRIYTKFLSHLLNTLTEVGMPYRAKANWLSFLVFVRFQNTTYFHSIREFLKLEGFIRLWSHGILPNLGFQVLRHVRLNVILAWIQLQTNFGQNGY